MWKDFPLSETNMLNWQRKAKSIVLKDFSVIHSDFELVKMILIKSGSKKKVIYIWYFKEWTYTFLFIYTSKTLFRFSKSVSLT